MVKRACQIFCANKGIHKIYKEFRIQPSSLINNEASLNEKS